MNIYKIQNPELYLELQQLIELYPKHYVKMLNGKNYQHLQAWIVSSLPLLNNNKYTMQTKCYWILNGLTDFPVCDNCHKKLDDKNVITVLQGYSKNCSIYCMTHSTAVSAKRKRTCKNKYGTEFAISAKQTREKAEQTCKERYGAKNVFDKNSTIFEHKFDRISKEVGKKITNISQIKNVAEKAKQTKIARYGNIGYDIEKLKRNNRKKYGVDFIFQYEPFKKHLKQIFMQKYGVDNPWKANSIQKRIRKRYSYDNKNFDSMPEIACYIYLVDHKINFEYHPNKAFTYYYNGKQYKTWPDFLVNNEYWEIKGNQFFNSDGTWKCPWNRDYDGLYEAKHQALIKNNVKIIRTSEYQIYIDYVVATYGNDYLIKYKRHK